MPRLIKVALVASRLPPSGRWASDLIFDTDPTGWHFAQMRLLGLDSGEKTIGVAVCDEEQVVATPLRTLPRRGGKRDVEAVAQVLAETGARGVVLGLPLELSGREGDAARRVRALGTQLDKGLDGVNVVYWDERFSTVEAERVLLEADMSRKKRKKVVNHVAACLILQGYLDHLAEAGQ